MAFFVESCHNKRLRISKISNKIFRFGRLKFMIKSEYLFMFFEK